MTYIDCHGEVRSPLLKDACTEHISMYKHIHRLTNTDATPSLAQILMLKNSDVVKMSNLGLKSINLTDTCTNIGHMFVGTQLRPSDILGGLTKVLPVSYTHSRSPRA